jgi:hypothetical protein
MAKVRFLQQWMISYNHFIENREIQGGTHQKYFDSRVDRRSRQVEEMHGNGLALGNNLKVPSSTLTSEMNVRILE